MKKEFLDLGRQPIANKFLREDEFKDEFFYNLKVVFDAIKLPIPIGTLLIHEIFNG